MKFKSIYAFAIPTLLTFTSLISYSKNLKLSSPLNYCCHKTLSTSRARCAREICTPMNFACFYHATKIDRIIGLTYSVKLVE
jgi:hypothetical protein